MFSGKTSSLLEAYTRHTIGQKKCILVKHSNDTRYSDVNVVVHDGRKCTSSIVCDSLCAVDNIAPKYQVICIDEIQFFDDAPIFCDKWANQGIIVEASGLCGTYARAEFPVISKLIPLAEEVYKKSAVCRETGKEAQFTYRTSDEVETVVIGGIDKYKPVDRKTFFDSCVSPMYKNYECKIFSEFVEHYLQKNNITISENMKSQLLNEFKQNDSEDKCFVDIVKQFVDRNNTIPTQTNNV
jgi:thymidine kinase